MITTIYLFSFLGSYTVQQSQLVSYIMNIVQCPKLLPHESLIQETYLNIVASGFCLLVKKIVKFDAINYRKNKTTGDYRRSCRTLFIPSHA